MAISGNYPAPVTVNGFSCRNCTDVDRARKNIDPANPSGGPFDINAAKADKTSFDSKHRFDRAALDALDAAAGQRASPASSPATSLYAKVDADVGARVDLVA